MNSPIIEKKSKLIAHTLVEKMLGYMIGDTQVEFQQAKDCAVVCAKQMLKSYKKGLGEYVPTEEIDILKSLPKAIESVKYINR